MLNVIKTKSSVKNQGRIYTPEFIVRNILDLANYKGDILEKNIIDNSCGDGAFLKEVINRYCESFLSQSKDLIRLLYLRFLCYK